MRFFSLSILSMMVALMIRESNLYGIPDPAAELNQIYSTVTHTARQSVVYISSWVPDKSRSQYKKISEGSGVLVSRNGYIVTNYHVIEGGSLYRVLFLDGTELMAVPFRQSHALALSDRKTDIALLRVELPTTLQIPILPLGDSDKIRVGEWVIAIGNPFGLHHTVTTGIISAKGRVNLGFADYEDFIQTDAAINPGNSGGALINLRGELIGINTAIKTNTGGYQGISFAIPINLVKRISKMLLSHGQVIRGWMGFIIRNRPLTYSPGKDQAVVFSVVPGSPAEQAGLKRGDHIIRYNGQVIHSFLQLRNLIATAEFGQQVILGIRRQDQYLQIRVTVGAKPTSERQKQWRQKSLFRLGIDAISSPSVPGIQVVYVGRNTPAANARLHRGDIITMINGYAIRSLRDYYSMLNAFPSGERISLIINRNGSIRSAVVSVR